MLIEMACPWCEGRLAADLRCAELRSVTCSACLSVVDVAGDLTVEDAPALTLAA